jgi:hypothetical protein
MTDIPIDDSVLLAEVTQAFHAYERALMADDVAAMDALFHAAPTTNRYGVGEVLYGIDAIRDFRKGRGGSPQRSLGRVAITVYGAGFATADAEFFRAGSDRRGRQSRRGSSSPTAGKSSRRMSASKGTVIERAVRT